MPSILTEDQLDAQLGGGQPGQIAMSNLFYTMFAAANYPEQPTPTAKTADATLTIAELLTRIVTVTSTAAVALTLPTGTLSDAGILTGALPVDRGLDWAVINLGSASGAVTMTAGVGHTYVGAAVVAIGTSARFRTRKTAGNTFITYRLA